MEKIDSCQERADTINKLILDLDTGVDDALAIAYALDSPEVELIGITGTYGNVLLDQRCA